MCRRLIIIFAFLIQGAFLQAASEDWPGFRGPNFDGSAPIDTSFGVKEGQLQVAWRSNLGAGYSGVSVVAGRALTLFSDGTNDLAAAFDSKTGKELWRYRIGPTYKGHDGSHNGPIATPVIADGRVFGLDAHGKLFALDVSSGKELWIANLAEGLAEDRKPFYGFGTSPLIAGGVLIVELGADANRAIAGYDPATGQRKWALGEDKVNYQSPIVIKWKSTEQVVAVGDTKLFGIDPAQGKILWEYVYQGEERAMANQSLVPVPSGEGLLFLKNKQDSSTMVRLTDTSGKLKVEPVWTAQVLKATYSLPVYHDGYLYGYNGRTVLTCVDAKTGELKWRSREPGDGFLLLLNGNLVIQAKEGSLHIGPASPNGWKETNRIDLFQKVSWTNPSFAEGAIFSRGQAELARIEWSTGKTAAKPAVASLGAPPVDSQFAKFISDVGSASDKTLKMDQFMASIPSFPYVEWPDRVHFIYRGTAEDMGIAGDMIGERREDPMLRVPGTDLFYYSIALEPDARLNYRFVKNYDEKLVDPRNNQKINLGERGDFSWFGMPGWNSPDFLNSPPESKRGKIESKELVSKARENTKAKFDVYLPVGYSSGKEPYPLVILIGGKEAQTVGMVPTALDNLIGNSVKPMIVVFLQDMDYGEKPPDDYQYQLDLEAGIVTNEVLPFIEKNYRTIPQSTSRA